MLMGICQVLTKITFREDVPLCILGSFYRLNLMAEVENESDKHSYLHLKNILESNTIS